MLRQALILTADPAYAGSMRHRLLRELAPEARIDIETDPIRTLQLDVRSYDLILLDVMIGEVDGLQLANLLRGRAPASTFVIVSELPAETFCFLAQPYGIEHCLTRPTSEATWQNAMHDLRRICGLPAATESSAAQADTAEKAVELEALLREESSHGSNCVLHLETGQADKTADIFIYGGEVFHAQYSGGSGEAALRHIAAWGKREGLPLYPRRHAMQQVPPRTIERPWQQILGIIPGAASLSAPPPPPPPGQVGAPTLIAQSFKEQLASPSVDATGLDFQPSSSPRDSESATTGTSPSGPGLAPTLWWRTDLTGQTLEEYQTPDPARAGALSYELFSRLNQAASLLETGHPRELRIRSPRLQHALVVSASSLRQAVFEPTATVADVEAFIQWSHAQPV